MQRRGHSLPELVIAMAILASCFFMILPMMHYALQYARKVEKGSLAALIAQSRLNSLRAWAQQPQGSSFQYVNLASQAHGPQPDPDHPDFTVQVRVSDHSLESPSRGLEAAYPGKQRVLANSCRQVQIDVGWTALGAPGSLTVVSLIGEPARRFRRVDPIVVSGSIPGQLARDGAIDFTVKAYDEQGREIDDLFYAWGVSPINGNGTISEQSRDGRKAKFQNYARRRNQVNHFYTGGTCKAEVRATFGGEERWALSDVIRLKD